MPFWVSIILALAGMIIFDIFIEGVVLMFLVDLFYGIHSVRFGGNIFIYLVSFSVLLALIEFLKVKMKVNSSGLGGNMGKLYNKL